MKQHPTKDKLNIEFELKTNRLWIGLAEAAILFAGVNINYAFDRKNHFIFGVWRRSNFF